MLKLFRSAFLGHRFSDKTAKNRLQMVLVQDRTGLSSDEMNNFKRDMLEVIGRYFVLERGNLEVDWQRNDSTVALLINTPVMGRSTGVEAKAASNE